MSTPTGAGYFPTPAEADQIAALADPVIRNLRITQSYHELSAALAQRTGAHANWCTFATWASKQAGQTIRQEDLARTLGRLLTTEPATRQAAGVVAALALQTRGVKRAAPDLSQEMGRALLPATALERASAAVARGNQKVFAEIGREFARFTVACLNDPAFDADTIARFCAALRPGDPPQGQRYLRQAFARYYQALFEGEAKTRAELILLANLEIGFHEQTRLQPEIAEALETALAGPGRITRDLLSHLFHLNGWPIYAPLLVMRLVNRPTPLDLAINQLITVARDQVRRLLTQHLMELGFPHGIRLRLGDDLRAGFPAALRHIADADLQSLLAQVDPTPDSLRETGAVDWASLPERLHFIADLFRCFALTPGLLEPPFTPEQTAEIKAGRRPVGPL